MTIEEYIEERKKRVANMTLAQARDLIAKTLSHSDMEMEFDKAVQMLLDCAEEKINSGWIPVTERLPEEEPNWIKCSEHLPDLDVDVLATTKEHSDVVKVTRWRTILKDCGWEWVLVDNIEGNAYNSDEIIAWMPLPKPYKAESEG